MDEVSQGDALRAIVDIDPEAIKLVGDLMERNAKDLAWSFEQAYLGERHAHEQTKARLAEANRQLDLIHRRVNWLLGGAEHEMVWE